MKKIILAILILIFYKPLLAQHIPAEQAEDSIVSCLKKMRYWRKHNTDSVYAVNKRLGQLMFDIGYEGYILTYDFKKLSAAGMQVHTSDDQMCRTFCWEVISVGPAHYYNYMMSYYQDAKRSMSFTNNSGASLTDIYTIKVDDYKTIYLMRDENKYDIKNRYSRLVAHTLKNGYLVITPYFYTNTDSESFAGYTYDLPSFNSKENKLPPVRLSADKKQVFVPIVKEGGIYKGGTIIFQRHDNGFVYEKYTEK